ncbi:MAG: hypothetical protein NC043_00030 [Muribaculaceae bacterium]|nr:hypothetical protein [Muribaculaceae bacterium]
MLTKETINSLYRKFDKRPSSPDELDIAILFEHLMDTHDVAIDDEAHLIIGTIPPDSPFHKLPLANIHAIVELADEIVIVLHSSLVILNKDDSNVHVHLRNHAPTVSERLSSLFGKLRADL